MAEVTENYRQERIERLLNELRYEVERGMMDGEIDETIRFVFFVGVSKLIPKGVVRCEFQTRPTPLMMVDPREMDKPRLQLVRNESHD